MGSIRTMTAMYRFFLLLLSSIVIITTDALLHRSFPLRSHCVIQQCYNHGHYGKFIRRKETKLMAISRRQMIAKTMPFVVSLSSVQNVNALPDCMSDCLKNCNLILPKDPLYCNQNCQDYCSQEDRTDGLSGSVNSDGGETGILGLNTVVKGEDRPPSIKLPGLDFQGSKGRKLIGY